MKNWNRWLLCGALAASSVACGGSNESGDSDELGGTTTGNVNVGQSDASGQAGFADAGAFETMPDAAVNDADMGSVEMKCEGLKPIIRDFTDSHPDFETYEGSGATTGLIQSTLTPEGKPIFLASKNQITSADSFKQWYTDVPGTNQRIEIPELELKPVAGGFEYDNKAFFPIDGKGFGNYEDSGHNFHFTTEIHTQFTYEGGQKFAFRGDDDLWIFVNGKLALDLGGLHEAVAGTIDFDAQAQKLGIEKGKTYRMDIFHAERHTVESNFRITTNIKCFQDAPTLY